MNGNIESLHGLIQIQNIGNTCYLNSTLQALLNVPRFRDHFLFKKYKVDLINTINEKHLTLEEKNDISKIALKLTTFMSYQIDKITDRIWNLDPKNYMVIPTLVPQTIKKIISTKNRDFDNYAEQDAHEFLMLFFQIITDEISYSIDYNPEYTEEEISFVSNLKQNMEELTELEKLKDLESIRIKKEYIRNLEELNVGSFKRYLQINALELKYEKFKYSICDELFSIGQINTLECFNCRYKSHRYEDNMYLFAEIPEITESQILSKIEEYNSNEISCKPSSYQSDQFDPLDTFDAFDQFDDLDDEDLDADFLKDSDEDSVSSKNGHESNLRVSKELPREDMNNLTDNLTSGITLDFNLDLNLKQDDIKNSIFRKRAINELEKVQIELTHCLDLTFKKEQLERKRTCEYCNEIVDASKLYTILNLPQYLIIQLKRFKVGHKKEHFIKFEEVLDMSKYMDPDLLENLRCNTTYNLINIINHTGTIARGHYYSYCKIAMHNQWFIMNDSRISLCDNIFTPNAYILIYEKN